MIKQYWAPDAPLRMKPEDRAGYQRALDAARKVPADSSPAGKAYVQYWVGRLEFAVGYLDAIQATKNCAIAEKAANDAKANNDSREVQVKLRKAAHQAEVARSTIVRAIEAYAGVAKNRADLGTIATMGEFVYRPLKQKAEELQSECDKLAEAP